MTIHNSPNKNQKFEVTKKLKEDHNINHLHFNTTKDTLTEDEHTELSDLLKKLRADK